MHGKTTSESTNTGLAKNNKKNKKSKQRSPSRHLNWVPATRAINWFQGKNSLKTGTQTDLSKIKLFLLLIDAF